MAGKKRMKMNVIGEGKKTKGNDIYKRRRRATLTVLARRRLLQELEK